MSRLATRSQRDWLEGEIAVWQSMGLLDAACATALMGLYETRQSFAARQQSQGLFTLLSLAAILVGLGVLLLIGYNWEQLPAAAKITVIFAALIGTHAAGLMLRFRLGWQQPSEVCLFLGCLLFGAAIWLLAQIFHIEASNFDALWWWAIGVLPFALLLDTVLIHLLFAGLLALWSGLDVFSLEGSIRGMAGVAYSLPILSVIGLWWAYRKGSAKTVAIYAPLLAWWVVLQPIAWKLPANPAYFIGALGAILILVAALHAAESAMAIPYRFYGIVLVGATLVPLSFHSVNVELARNSELVWSGGLEQSALIVILGAATILAAYFFKRSTHDDVGPARGSQTIAPGPLLQQQALPCGLLVMFAILAALSTTLPEPILPTISANIAMVIVALWLIRLGLATDRSRPFGAGVAYLLLWAVLRYSDLFGAFGGMLGASLMFFLAGGVLIMVALYWRNRKGVSLA